MFITSVASMPIEQLDLTCQRPYSPHLLHRQRATTPVLALKDSLATSIYSKCVYIDITTYVCNYMAEDQHLVLSRGPLALCYKPLSRPAVSNPFSQISRGYD